MTLPITVTGWICFVLTWILFVIVGIVFYKYYDLKKHVVSRSRKIANKSYANHQQVLTEINQREASVAYRENQIHIEYNKLKDSLQMQFDKRLDTIKKEYKEQAEADSKELDEAIEAQEKELMASIKKVDEMLEEKIKSLTLENTLLFDCVCGNKDIPCYISLNRENTFRCDQCNSVYAVTAKFSPVLLPIKASSEEEFNKLIEARLKEQQSLIEEDEIYDE